MQVNAKYIHSYIVNQSICDGASVGLRSASSADLAVPQTRLQTVGDRAFSLAAPKTWNSLPSEVTPSVTLSTFKQKLKTYLFALSFPGM